MSKHTPGPWQVQQRNTTKDGTFTEITAIEGRLRNLARVYTSDDDANLIAAAPDLLAALEGMVEVYAGSTPWNPASSTELELHDLARAAIARAKGESK